MAKHFQLKSSKFDWINYLQEELGHYGEKLKHPERITSEDIQAILRALEVVRD